VDYRLGLYWINDTSPTGYMAEHLLLAQNNDMTNKEWIKQTVTGKQIRYIDWVLPGILGMNMMFSCLFGVGYVIVRYRKSMVLKRLNATPVSAFEFLSAQIVSRLMIVMCISSVIFLGCDIMFDFYMLGSYFDLFIIAILGAMSLISLGLIIAARSQSEELTGGLLNMASWPMMIFSGVWFSLEGSPEIIQQLAYWLPLTHLVESARAIMTEGANLYDLREHIAIMIVMTGVFLGLGTLTFRWNGDGR
jgi:ABC-type multidrug transport system permease subunit